MAMCVYVSVMTRVKNFFTQHYVSKMTTGKKEIQSEIVGKKNES